MPVYEYACSACGHEFEEWRKMSDPPLLTCPKCKKKKVERLISATAFQLKGGGWYKDLYSSSKPAGKDGEGKSGDGKSGDAKSGEGKSGDAKSGDAKSGEGKSSEAKGGEGSSGKAGKDAKGEGAKKAPAKKSDSRAA